MSVYVSKNNQKLGPLDEAEVLANLKRGEFSVVDQASRDGETAWMPLGTMFPGAAPVQIIKATGRANSGAGKYIGIAVAIFASLLVIWLVFLR